MQDQEDDSLEQKLRSLPPLPGVSLALWQAFVNEAILVITHTEFRHWPIDTDEEDLLRDPRDDQSYLQACALIALDEAQGILRVESSLPLVSRVQREFANWRKSTDDIWVACVWAQLELGRYLDGRVTQAIGNPLWANAMFLLENVLSTEAVIRVKTALER